MTSQRTKPICTKMKFGQLSCLHSLAKMPLASHMDQQEQVITYIPARCLFAHSCLLILQAKPTPCRGQPQTRVYRCHCWCSLMPAGIIPRVVKQLFKDIEKETAGSQWRFQVTVSYVEIYNEKVFDLLEFKDNDLPIREDQQRNIFIPGLIEVFIGFCYSCYSSSFILKHRSCLSLSRYLARNGFVFRKTILLLLERVEGL